MVDESGATSIEYGLVAALIALAIVASVDTVGSSLQSSYATTATALKN